MTAVVEQPPKKRVVGGRPRRSEQMQLLEEENRQLRERLGIAEPRTIDTWEEVGTQEVRDLMAARALMAEWLNPFHALVRLGFKLEHEEAIGNRQPHLTKEMHVLAARVFGTAGVIEIIKRDLSDVAARKPEIYARMVEISLHGSEDAAVRAAQMLAKLEGWQETPDPPDAHVVNLYVGIGERREEKAMKKADTTFLDHEPGEPKRVVDVDLPIGVQRAIETGEIDI